MNELDETNNDWTEGPIIVEAPGYGFLGLQTPCTGTTCNKTRHDAPGLAVHERLDAGG